MATFPEPLKSPHSLVIFSDPVERQKGYNPTQLSVAHCWDISWLLSCGMLAGMRQGCKALMQQLEWHQLLQ